MRVAHMKPSDAMILAPRYLQPPGTKQAGKTDHYRFRGSGVISSTCENFLTGAPELKSAVEVRTSKSDLSGVEGRSSPGQHEQCEQLGNVMPGLHF